MGKRRIVAGCLVILLMVVGAYFAFTLWVSSVMKRDVDANWEAISRVHLDCPTGQQEEVERWSKLGAMRYCELDGLWEGPWEAWEHGRLQIRGTYSAGKQDGAFRYYDDEGRVERVVVYESDVELGRLDDFDSDTWIKGEDAQWTTERPVPRLEMADRLVEKNALVGMQRGAVAAILGPPTRTDKFQDWDLVYWLGVERGYIAIDSKWLVIDFDDDSLVSEARTFHD